MNPTEHVGTLYIENQRLLGEYRKLLEVLARVGEGRIPAGSIEVDLDKLSWAIAVTPN